MIRVNPFAKFGAISDATPLWRSAAEQLSTYAAEVGPIYLCRFPLRWRATSEKRRIWPPPSQ